MKENSYQLWFWAAIYAFLFTYVTPWSEIIGHDFVDIFNYLERITYLKGGGDEKLYSGIQWLMSEPLWKFIIVAIGNIFDADNYRLAIYMVSFISLLLYASFLFRRTEYYIGMILMFNPMAIDLFMGQIRSAFAFALLLFAYDLVSKRWRIVLLISATLIHAAMPIFILIYMILNKLNQEVESKKYYLIAIFTAFFIAFFMRYGLDILLALLGDRHAGYKEVIKGASIAYSIVWFMIALVIATFATFEDAEDRIIAGYAITMMSFFFFSSLFGVFAQRYVALTLPLIIISIGYLPKHFKQGTYVLLFAYTLLMFKYWLANS